MSSLAASMSYNLANNSSLRRSRYARLPISGQLRVWTADFWRPTTGKVSQKRGEMTVDHPVCMLLPRRTSLAAVSVRRTLSHCEIEYGAREPRGRAAPCSRAVRRCTTARAGPHSPPSLPVVSSARRCNAVYRQGVEGVRELACMASEAHLARHLSAVHPALTIEGQGKSFLPDLQ